MTRRIPSRTKERAPRWRGGVLAVPVVLLAMLGSLSVLPPARANDDHDHDRDHDRAREAVRAGDVLPLHVVLERLQRDHPGQVLDVELERGRGGQWTYEIRLLQPGGRRVKIEVDARTGRVLQRTGARVPPAASGARTPSAPMSPP